MRRIFRGGRYANVTATMALIVALGGTSYAAITLPRNSVGTKQLKPRAVARSDIRANAVTSAKVRNGSLLSKDFKAGQIPAGPAGPAGAPGPVGPAGPAGPFPATLPSGKTLVGAYGLIGTGANQRAGDNISFLYPLAVAPTGHFIKVGAVAPTECPGSAAAPTAAPGNLCIYEGNADNVTVQSFEDPVTAATGSVVRPYGALVVAFSGAVSGNFRSEGSWAVTAP